MATDTRDVCPKPGRVDGPGHSWRFDGDSPVVFCHFCGERRDALTGEPLLAARTPEAQRDAEPPAMTGSITERHSGDIAGQRDAGNRGIDRDRIARAVEAFCLSKGMNPAPFLEVIAAATQPPAAGTEGTE